MIRKPGRLDDEKPETWPVMANCGFTGSACMLRAVVGSEVKASLDVRERMRGVASGKGDV